MSIPNPNSAELFYNTPLPTKHLYGDPGDVVAYNLDLEGLDPNSSYYVEPVYILPLTSEVKTLYPDDWVANVNANVYPFQIQTDRIGRALFTSRPPLTWSAPSTSGSVTRKPEFFSDLNGISDSGNRLETVTLSARIYDNAMNLVHDVDSPLLRPAQFTVGTYPRIDVSCGNMEVTKTRMRYGSPSVSVTVDLTANGFAAAGVNGSFTIPIELSGVIPVIYPGDDAPWKAWMPFTFDNFQQNGDGKRTIYPSDLMMTTVIWDNLPLPGMLKVSANLTGLGQFNSGSKTYCHVIIVDPVWSFADSTISGLSPGRDYRVNLVQIQTTAGGYLDAPSGEFVGTTDAQGVLSFGFDSYLSDWALRNSGYLPNGESFQIVAQLSRFRGDDEDVAWPNLNDVGTFLSDEIYIE